MSKRINRIIYYIIIIFLFLIEDRIILLFQFNNKDNVINEVLRMENNDLKDEVYELSNINYNDYDYVLGKIVNKDLYNSDVYYIKVDEDINDEVLVINEYGLLGIYNNGYLKLCKDLRLSIKINDNIGTLEDGYIKIKHDNYKIGDLIFTSGLTKIKGDLLIGKISNIKNNNELIDIISIDYINNNSTYVGLLVND